MAEYRLAASSLNRIFANSQYTDAMQCFWPSDASIVNLRSNDKHRAISLGRVRIDTCLDICIEIFEVMPVIHSQIGRRWQHADLGKQTKKIIGVPPEGYYFRLVNFAPVWENPYRSNEHLFMLSYTHQTTYLITHHAPFSFAVMFCCISTLNYAFLFCDATQFCVASIFNSVHLPRDAGNCYL